MSGKGSAPRPFSVSNEEYAGRWAAIFGTDKKDKPKEVKLDFFCPHEVWTVTDGKYHCMSCGQESDAGPYHSR